MGKNKKPFIDRNNAAHFHLVHRSQRDPKTADPNASQRVLTPAEISANMRGTGASERASQASRSWAIEQNLDGFDTADPNAKPAPVPEPVEGEEYNYAQHLREMGSGTFIPREAPDASHASLPMSGISRSSRISRLAEVKLRAEVGDDAFASTEELQIGVGGATNHHNAEVEADEAWAQDEEMDDDLWAALHDDDEDIEECDDDFVVKANRHLEGELVLDTTRGKRVVPKTINEDVADEDEDGEESECEGEDWESDGGDTTATGSRPAGARGGGEDRMLDRQFEKLMADYDSDEIGELDEDDPTIRGSVPLVQYDKIMDAHLADHAVRSSVQSFNDYREGWRGTSGEAGVSGVWTGKPPVEAESDGDDEIEVDAAGNYEAEEAPFPEEHPYFDVLKEKPKEAEWDAETILSTYSTTENHPRMIRAPRRPRDEQIKLHPKTGLPMGVELPGTAAARAAAAAAGGPKTAALAAWAEDDDDDDCAPQPNLGEARERGEKTDAKRQRKQAVREQKQARRQEKKETKLAFAGERNQQLDTRARTKQTANIPLGGY